MSLGMAKQPGKLKVKIDPKTGDFASVPVSPDSAASAEPSELGKVIQALHEKRQEQKAAQAIVDKFEAEAKAIETDLLERFKKNELDGALEGGILAKIIKKEHPQISDRPAFLSWVREHDAFDLLYQRVSSRAYAARLDNDEKPEGVAVYTTLEIKTKKLNEP